MALLLPRIGMPSGIRATSIIVTAAIGLTVAPGFLTQSAQAAKPSEKSARMSERDVVSSRDLAAIQKVIRDQMAAFSVDDAETAFGFAAPVVQQRFGNADRFIAMVKTGYAPLYRPRMVSFDTAKPAPDSDETIIQSVLVQGPTGLLVTALYRMVRVDGGEWRIAGCVLTRSADMAL